MKLKRILAIGGACIAFLLLLVILVNLFQPGRFIQPKSQATFLYRNSNNQIIAMVDDYVLETELGEDIIETQTNLKGTTVAVLTTDNTLYLINNKKVNKVSDKVRDFTISSNASIIAYADHDDTLRLYDGDASIKIAENVYEDEFAISPDGKTVLYTTQDKESDECELFIYNGVRSVSLGVGLYPVGVSDKGEYIYACSDDMKALYMCSPEGEKDKISDFKIGWWRPFLNTDHTEIVFYTEDGTYISVKGSEKKKLSESPLVPVIPDESLIIFGSVANICSSDSFLNVFYMNDNERDLYFINGEGKSEKLNDNVNYVRVSEDGKEVIYTARDTSDVLDKLYRMNVKDLANPKELASGISRYVTSPDGKQIYYTNDDDELWWIDRNSSPKKIADDVGIVAFTTKNNALFISGYDYETGGTLYWTNGKDKKKIEENVIRIITGKNHSGYLLKDNEETDLYINSGKLKFKLAAEDVSIKQMLLDMRTRTGEEHMEIMFYTMR